MRYVERPLYNKESVLIPRKGTLNNVMYVNQPFWSVDTMFYTEMKLPACSEEFVYHIVKAKRPRINECWIRRSKHDNGYIECDGSCHSLRVMPLKSLNLWLRQFEAMQANDVQSKSTVPNAMIHCLPKLMSGEIDVSDIKL